jgi:hypothetical protein
VQGYDNIIFLKDMLLREKEIPLNLRFEYIFDYLSIKMILNDKSMNYKVVTLDESYKFRITFIYILGSCERNIYFKKYASREETFVSIYLSINMSYGPPWADYLGGYQDRLLGGPLGLPDLCRTVPVGVRRKDYGGEVLR